MGYMRLCLKITNQNPKNLSLMSQRQIEGGIWWKVLLAIPSVTRVWSTLSQSVHLHEILIKITTCIFVIFIQRFYVIHSVLYVVCVCLCVHVLHGHTEDRGRCQIPSSVPEVLTLPNAGAL